MNLNGLWGLCPLLTLIELPSLIQFVMEYSRPPWGLRTRCRLMNAVQVGDLSFIPRSQWVKSKWFASFHSSEYNLGCPACMFVCCISRKDPRQWGLGCWKYPTSSIYNCFSMNFEWFMRIVSTSHFDWVAIPHTVFEGVVASTVGTKDPLSSDEWSSSGWSEPYPLLSVSKINAVCMLFLLWVQSGMSSIHVCVVYSIRTQDSVVMGVGSTLLPAYALP